MRFDVPFQLGDRLDHELLHCLSFSPPLCPLPAFYTKLPEDSIFDPGPDPAIPNIQERSEVPKRRKQFIFSRFKLTVE